MSGAYEKYLGQSGFYPVLAISPILMASQADHIPRQIGKYTHG